MSRCKLALPGQEATSADGGCGKVQWDPERDLHSPEPKGRTEPRKLLRRRAIQIGVSGPLSEYYVANVAGVEDVTDLAKEVYEVHAIMKSKRGKAKQQAEERMSQLREGPLRDRERPYLPACGEDHLVRLGMLPGDPARDLAQLGFGKATPGRGS